MRCLSESRNGRDEVEDECSESDGMGRVEACLEVDGDGVVDVLEDTVPVEWAARRVE